MTQKQSPEDLLEFPCQYQFKALGNAGDEFKAAIVQAVSAHVAVPLDAIHSRPSGKGNYQAVSVMVTLHNYIQLTSIYAEMKQVAGLKMLL